VGPRGFFLSNPLCFGVERGELEERLEAQFYQPKYLELEHKLKQCPYPVQHLRDLAVQIVDGPFGSQLKVEEYVSAGVPLVRVSDVKAGELVDDGLVFITPEKQEQLKRSQVLPGDVILTKAGAILGYSAVFPDRWPEGNITSHSVSIRCKDIVRNRYLSFYLRSEFGNRQIYRWGSKSTRPELNTGEVGHILVVVPPLDVQDAIADKMDAAHQRKRELEAEAEVLLESIDGYVLGELRIELGPAPAPRPWFEGWASKVKGGRLDVGSASNTFDPRSFPSAKWAQLCEIAALPRETLDTRGMPDEEFLFVGMTDVDDELGQVTMHRLSGREIGQSKRVFKGGDTVFARIEPCIYNRKIALIPEDVELAVGSTELLVARPRKEIKSQFLTLCLRSELIQRQIVGLMTGTTGRRRLPHSDFASLFVPVCSMEKQSEIVVEVQRRRERAVALRAEAEWVVAEAKTEVERMILGEEGG
jgi:type I restriction enzyme S subunit